MCLIIFAYRPSTYPQYELVVTANRDEAYDRPTTPAHVWSAAAKDDATTANDNNNNKQLLYGFVAGQDEQAGGTWLGVDREQGRFAAVTNFWGPQIPSLDTDEDRPEVLSATAKSRGVLAVDFLSNPNMSAREYMEQLQQDPSTTQSMNGFSLLVMDQKSGMFYYNNREEGKGVQQLTPGVVYGLSNGFLNSNWPKVQSCRNKMENLLQQQEKENNNNMINKKKLTVQALRGILTKEDVGRECTHAFIKDTDHGFGTLSNAVVMIPSSNNNNDNTERKVTFSEHMYDVTGATINTAEYQWELPPQISSQHITNDLKDM